MTEKFQAPEGAPVALAVPRPFDAVKSFANGVLKMLDERIEVAARASHPFMDKFGDHPETIVAAKAQASELREVRNQVRILGDRALVDLMKFRPAAREAAPAQTWRADYPASEAELSAEREKARADERLYGLGATVNGWHVPAHVVSIYRLSAAQSPAEGADLPPLPAPRLYCHELIENKQLNPTLADMDGIWLGCNDLNVVQRSHTPGETGEEILALYTAEQMQTYTRSALTSKVQPKGTEPTLICPACKVDRFKAPCPGDRTCPMVGQAQGASPAQAPAPGPDRLRYECETHAWSANTMQCPDCAAAQAPAVQDGVPATGWVCSQCGIDRCKAACPLGHNAALTGKCPMVGIAQAHVPVQHTEAQR